MSIRLRLRYLLLGLLVLGLLSPHAGVDRLQAEDLIVPVRPPSYSHNIERIDHLGGTLGSIAVQDRYAYAIQGNALVTLDLVDPAHPMTVGTLALTATGSLYATEHTIYLAAGQAGLWVIDSSNPKQLVVVGHAPAPLQADGTAAWVDAVTVADGYAYLNVFADYRASVRILDVRDPAQIKMVGRYPLPENQYIAALQIQGRYVYVSAWAWAPAQATLRIIDIADPTTPSEVGSTIILNGDNGIYHSYDLKLSGAYAYVADAEGLHIVDIDDPAHPTVIGFYDSPLSAIFSVGVLGHYAYVSNNFEFQVINIADPSAPTLAGRYVPRLSRPYPGPYAIIAGSGNHVYIHETNQFSVLRVTNPVQPTLVGAYAPIAEVRGIAVSGNHAYLAAGMDGLRVWDVSDPIHPVETGAYTSTYTTTAPVSGLSVQDVVVQGRYAYTSANDGGQLRIFDISNPVLPTPVGIYTGTEGLYDFAVSGPYAYTSGWAGLRVVDISNPTSPAAVAAFPFWMTEIDVHGSYIYGVAGRLRILDATNPTSITVVSSYPATRDPFDLTYMTDVTVADAYAYVLDTQGLKILDVTNPVTPTLAGSYSISGANDITVRDKIAYISVDHGTRLLLLDVSNPMLPQAIGRIRGLAPYASGWPEETAVAPNGRYLYVSDAGLSILRYTGLSVAGDIYAPNGQPAQPAGITVMVGQQPLTLTNGRYAVQELAVGTYPITPTLRDYTFWPPTRTVTLPADDGLQNFVVLPKPVTATVVPSETTSLIYTDTQGLATQFVLGAGAITTTTTLTITPTIATSPVGSAFTGHAFAVAVEQGAAPMAGVTFASPLTVTLHYSDKDTWTVSDTAQLALRWWDGRAWVDAAQTCAVAGAQVVAPGTLEVEVCRTGRFALFGPTHQQYLALMSNSYE